MPRRFDCFRHYAIFCWRHAMIFSLTRHYYAIATLIIFRHWVFDAIFFAAASLFRPLFSFSRATPLLPLRFRCFHHCCFIFHIFADSAIHDWYAVYFRFSPFLIYRCRFAFWLCHYWFAIFSAAIFFFSYFQMPLRHIFSLFSPISFYFSLMLFSIFSPFFSAIIAATPFRWCFLLHFLRWLISFSSTPPRFSPRWRRCCFTLLSFTLSLFSLLFHFRWLRYFAFFRALHIVFLKIVFIISLLIFLHAFISSLSLFTPFAADYSFSFYFHCFLSSIFYFRCCWFHFIIFDDISLYAWSQLFDIAFDFRFRFIFACCHYFFASCRHFSSYADAAFIDYFHAFSRMIFAAFAFHAIPPWCRWCHFAAIFSLPCRDWLLRRCWY